MQIKSIFIINFVFLKVRCQDTKKTPLLRQNIIICDVFGFKYLKLTNSAMSFDIWKGNGASPSLKKSNPLHNDL